MEIKIYVDWKEEEILTEKEYKDFKDRRTNEIADGYYEDKDNFDEFLAENYTFADIFEMTDEEKEKAKTKWRTQCKEGAEETFDDEHRYEKITLEV